MIMRADIRFLVHALLVTSVFKCCEGCGPSRLSRRRPPTKKISPLVFRQHVPNVSENSIQGSGPPEGQIHKEDPKFRDLIPNYNPDIIFKDEEGTGADRLMTERCKEKLNTLAISVMNQWPGLRLRVTEGWDEERRHTTDSLHYEGRAVDVTTEDRDRGKYGMLARLAVEAGFDWVYYESRAHIHCSVKSESSQASRNGGCFTGDSIVQTSNGNRRKLSELRIGEKVLSMDKSGSLIYSEVLMFMDRDPEQKRQFLKIHTAGGESVTVTPAHLLMVLQRDKSNMTKAAPSFADTVVLGDRLLVRTGHDRLEVQKVVLIEIVLRRGVYAPLTTTGTVVVDDVVASCYALIDSQWVAHWSFAPMRAYWNFKEGTAAAWRFLSRPSATARENDVLDEEPVQQGVHWYASTLYSIASFVLPPSMLHK